MKDLPRVIIHKKIERVKNVIEPTCDSYLAKENADLRRRLEISCKFLLKKKEKIEKLQEKINTLNKRINDMIKSKMFSENEEEKIKDILNKKLKNEKHPVNCQLKFPNNEFILNNDLTHKNCEVI